MKNKKLSSLLILIILTTGFFITLNTPKISATVHNFYAKDVYNSTAEAARGPTAGYRSMVGMVPGVGNGEYLVYVTYNLKRDASTTGQINVGLVNWTSKEFIENSSTPLNVSTLTTSLAYYTFEFSGDSLLSASTTWGFVIYITDALGGIISMGLATGGVYAYFTVGGSWATTSGSMLGYILTDDVEGGAEYPDPPSNTTLTYNYAVVGPAPLYTPVYPTFIDWTFQVDLNQSIPYSYNGQLFNNSMPWVNGTFYVWKTPIDNISWDNAVWDMAFDNFTLNYSAPLVNGWVPWLSLYKEYTPDSGTFYQGMRINFTVDGANETFTSDLLLIFHEPLNSVFLQLTGDVFVNANLAESPTQITLKQSFSGYSFRGYVYMNYLLNGTGNFTIYSTGISSSSAIMSIGTFTQTSFGTIGNGTFTFALAPRSASNVVFEGFRVVVLLDTGLTQTFTYFFGWYRPGDSFNGLTPYPAVTSQPISSAGVIDSDGYSNFLTGFVGFMLLFILVGAPALLLGTKAGLPGLIVGGMLGLGIGVAAGLIAWWFIFLIASGVAVAFVMYRRNDGQG